MVLGSVTKLQHLCLMRAWMFILMVTAYGENKFWQVFLLLPFFSLSLFHSKIAYVWAENGEAGDLWQKELSDKETYETEVGLFVGVSWDEDFLLTYSVFGVMIHHMAELHLTYNIHLWHAWGWFFTLYSSYSIIQEGRWSALQGGHHRCHNFMQNFIFNFFCRPRRQVSWRPSLPGKVYLLSRDGWRVWLLPIH